MRAWSAVLEMPSFWRFYSAQVSDEDLEQIKRDAIGMRRENVPDDELTKEWAKRILALLSFLFSLDHSFQRGDYLGLAQLIQVSIIGK